MKPLVKTPDTGLIAVIDKAEKLATETKALTDQIDGYLSAYVDYMEEERKKTILETMTTNFVNIESSSTAMTNSELGELKKATEKVKAAAVATVIKAKDATKILEQSDEEDEFVVIDSEL